MLGEEESVVWRVIVDDNDFVLERVARESLMKEMENVGKVFSFIVGGKKHGVLGWRRHWLSMFDAHRTLIPPIAHFCLLIETSE